MMKVCLLADLHLFSTEIGGEWSEDSFNIFRDDILPKIKQINPDLTIFLGDILDPSSGERTPRWPSGDEINEKFVTSLENADHDSFYALKGNHDYLEPLRNIEQMGGPKLINDEWLKAEDNAFYFFTSRYPNSKKAANDLDNIPNIEASNKFLIMHETVSISGEGKIDDEIINRLSERFDAIFNGHQHAYSEPQDNLYCLSSALPWRPKYGSSNYEITWEVGGEEENEPNFNVRSENIHGIYLYHTTKEKLEFIPVDRKIEIATARLDLTDVSAAEVRSQLLTLADKLKQKVEQEKTVVRVYLQGSLQEGEERIDIGLTDIERDHFGDFYEGPSKNVIHASDLQGGGAYLEKEDLQYLSVERALDKIEERFSDIQPFYDEVKDIIEQKTFQSDQLVQQIEESKLLEEEGEE